MNINKVVAIVVSALAIFANAEEVLISIQESKVEDLRPKEEQIRFSNLRPFFAMVKHAFFIAGYANIVDEKDMGSALQMLEQSQVVDGMDGEADKTLKIPGVFLRFQILQYAFVDRVERNPVTGIMKSQRSLTARINSTFIDARTARTLGSASVVKDRSRVLSVNSAQVHS